MSPAWPWSSSLWNISTPVQTVFWVGPQPDDLDVVADLDDALLDAAGDDRATAGDGHDVLDRHQEGLVDLAGRLGDEVVHGLHELEDALGGLRVALERLEGADPHDGGVVAGELVAR